MILSRFALPANAALVALLLVSCEGVGTTAGSGGHPTGTGPFDSRGNYVEAWADNPARWRGGDRKPTPVHNATPQPTRTQPAVVASTSPQPAARPTQPAARPTQPAARPTPPRPVAQTRRYTVKRGDTLSRIASQHRTTVAALRRANGISGDLIRVGQVLKIP